MNQAPRHYAHCVRYCTDIDAKTGEAGCHTVHECWCGDNDKTYAQFAAEHPDHDPVAAQDTERRVE